PASAAACLHEQEFYTSAANAVTDGSDLVASTQAAKMRQADEFRGRLRNRAHASRVHDGSGVWVESKLVPGGMVGARWLVCARKGVTSR
ncbi:MAG: hypothetical protein WAL32_19260, partial [Terriglobales bacterium]